MVQRTRGDKKTFGEVAGSMILVVLHKVTVSQRIYWRRLRHLLSYNPIRGPERENWDSDTRTFLHAAHATAAWYWALVNAQQRKMPIYLFSLWLRKASSRVLCLSNLVKRLEQDTWMCQELFQCWVQNWADLLLVSTPSLTSKVSVSIALDDWLTHPQ